MMALDTLKITLIPTDEYLTPDTVLSLPTDLLPRSRALADLLNACGVPPCEAAFDGTAPAYDRWASLCASLPLMPGHPLVRRLHALIRALGCDEGLDAGTAASAWRSLAEIMGCEAGSTLTVGGLCERMGQTLTTVLRPDREIIGKSMPDGLDGLASVEQMLDGMVSGTATPVLFLLPEAYAYTRPNPYRAEQYLKKALSHGAFSWGALTPAERDLFLTQLIRICGARCRYTHVLWLAGRTEQLTALCAYLSASGTLPQTVRFLTDPEDADTPLPAPDGADVQNGLWLSGGDTPLTLRRKLTAYAERMPLACAERICLSVRTPTDLAQPDTVREVLTALQKEWADAAGTPATGTPADTVLPSP